MAKQQSSESTGGVPGLGPEHAEMLVLSVLASGPAWGYRVSKEVAARSEGAFSLGPAKLYPLFTKLEKQGLVTASWEEIRAEGADPEGKGRRRKWYRLSDKGRRRLASRIESHRRFTALIEAFLPSDDSAEGALA